MPGEVHRTATDLAGCGMGRGGSDCVRHRGRFLGLHRRFGGQPDHAGVQLDQDAQRGHVELLALRLHWVAGIPGQRRQPALGVDCRGDPCRGGLADRRLGRQGCPGFFKLPGISIPQGWAITSVPIIKVFNWIVEKIPGLRDVYWDSETLQKRLGIFGQPIIMGAILGLLFGILATASTRRG